MKLHVLIVIGLLFALQGMQMFQTHDMNTVHKSIGKTPHTHYSKVFIKNETCIEYYDSERILGSYVPVYVCENR